MLRVCDFCGNQFSDYHEYWKNSDGSVFCCKHHSDLYIERQEEEARRKEEEAEEKAMRELEEEEREASTVMCYHCGREFDDRRGGVYKNKKPFCTQKCLDAEIARVGHVFGVTETCAKCGKVEGSSYVGEWFKVERTNNPAKPQYFCPDCVAKYEINVAGKKYKTIQAAIDAAPEGTEIVIPKGLYKEKLEINKNITLRGESSKKDDLPIIYCKPEEEEYDADGVFVVKITSPCTLKNLCIRGEQEFDKNLIESASNSALILCTADANLVNILACESIMKGIIVLNASPTITKCEFYRNYGMVFKGKGSNPIVKDTDINELGWSCKCDAVYVAEGCNGEFTNCKIVQNSIGVSLDGEKGVVNPKFNNCSICGNSNSGILVYNNAQGLFESCDIDGNSINKENGTQVDVFKGGNPTFRNCQIHNGSAVGGVFVYEKGKGRFENCEIYDNKGDNVINKGKTKFVECKKYYSSSKTNRSSKKINKKKVLVWLALFVAWLIYMKIVF